MKLKDKLRNYYHSDLDQLFHEDNSDVEQKNTEYTSKEREIASSGLFQAEDGGTEYNNRKRQTEGEDTIVDKQTKNSETQNLDSNENIYPFEPEEIKLEVNALNKIIHNISQESNEYNGIADKESVDKNPIVRIDDNLTNKENNLLDIENTEVTIEHANQTQNTPEINYIKREEKANSSEDYKRYEDSHIDKDNTENSKEINNEHANTWMRQFSLGFNKNDNGDDGYKTSSGSHKNNYIIQLNIQI